MKIHIHTRAGKTKNKPKATKDFAVLVASAGYLLLAIFPYVQLAHEIGWI